MDHVVEFCVFEAAFHGLGEGGAEGEGDDYIIGVFRGAIVVSGCFDGMRWMDDLHSRHSGVAGGLQVVENRAQAVRHLIW